MRENESLKRDKVINNFMGGESYQINPLDTLKMISASSIFGEPSYYRKDVRDGIYRFDNLYSDKFEEVVFSKFDGKTTTEIFTKAIDDSLSYNFEETLNFAVELRTTYNMRLNPQIIMVRAAIHPKRIEFSKNKPGKFSEIESKVMLRADEPMSQLVYYMYTNRGNKAKLPTILKKNIAKKLSSLDAYSVNKYKNHEIGIINAVRITHANSDVLNELMKTGTVNIPVEEETWEQKRSAGVSWKEIISTCKLGHMAMLRNIRNVFKEIDDFDTCKKYMETLKNGVLKGKQFPFRYYNAYIMIESNDEIHHKQYILDVLEECIDISIAIMPKLKGKTICLSDNSGSAWGAFTSEFGRNTIAEIDNLSSVIAAACSDEGYVGKFGDKLIMYPISKRNGILKQTKEITKDKDTDVGGGTEGGIWEFFKKAIDNNEHWDNILIFSDQQAGTGGLYGTNSQICEYKNEGYALSTDYINVYKLILDYRKYVNPIVNVASVQTAGYNNILIPELSYRTALLKGWTGKEVQFMSEYIKQWDSIDSRNKSK